MTTSKPITERQQAFLDAYRVHGKVKPAAEQAGCSRELHYGAMRTSETYREEFSLVQLRLADELEEAMWQRAVYGVKIPKFYRGEVIGYEIRYSDVLLMRLLEAKDPEKFGGIRKELQEQARDAGFCVRWDRDEVGRPTLPRMTGPQPPAPPRPPRPPVPSISECGIPVTYAEWAAARGITERVDCGPVDQEKLQRWAAGEDFGSVEWVPEEAAMDAASADAEEAFAEADGPGSDDSDVDFSVRSERRGEETQLLPGRGWGRASLGEILGRRWPRERRIRPQRSAGATRGMRPGAKGRILRPAAWEAATAMLDFVSGGWGDTAVMMQRRLRAPGGLTHSASRDVRARPGRACDAAPASLQPSSAIPPPEHRPLASQPPWRNPSCHAAPVQRDAG